ncbi:MAG: NAD(P)/FAD-dependent oxidoreductase [Actinomycetia bacterium]|nr:NAD(P)/FAD-dependent oxidoreductase [Actinomycetes bacterium]
MKSAVVVGSGPNGLVAAVTLARAGWRVTVHEASDTPGGGTRSAELTAPGALSDVCSAVHPLAVASPVMRSLPLEEHGLAWVHPEAPLGHALADGRAVMLERSIQATADGLGPDAAAWKTLMGPLADSAGQLVDTVLTRSPAALEFSPRSLAAAGRFALAASRSASALAGRFEGERARALLAGLAGHSVLRLDRAPSGGVGLMLGLLAHVVGWPVARGGSQAIADALVSVLHAEGGEVVTAHRVESLAELGDVDAVLLDTSVMEFARLAGHALPAGYERSLGRVRQGPGVCKVDWLLDGQVPWADERLLRAGTVHLGGNLEQIAAAESGVWAGRHPERPYVLLAQQSLFDPTRLRSAAVSGAQVVWAYTHTPVGSTLDVSDSVAAVVEQAAPGFRDRILSTRVMSATDMQRHNTNYPGGDITGGIADLRGMLVRPTVVAPWRTPLAGLYLCSASTPPGAGVHGMCGWHAARCVLVDHGSGRPRV